ncbi:hypothetical protein [Devosia sp. 63-57]|uniref:hypothetical protein n=1 Tax=Devosia sp. 63-57 TaxID=1895751 RepID=UPI00086DF3C4|nr:hypothetical protein [Devosia sp. 63-57]ODU82758.1 MAG: hypothetical protein ABT14_16575 [Pelagibacterium sp. SCN 63-17]
MRYRVQPRCVPKPIAARRLGLTEARFAESEPQLRQNGFPLPDAVTGHYDLVAIDAWLDRKAGLSNSRPTAIDAADGFAERLASLG